MLSLGFGLLAALAWAVHDLLVRKLTQDAAILPMLLVVAGAGTAALLVPALILGGWETLGRAAVLPAVAAGLVYIAGMLGLYEALSRAPVRIVAPILGAYPILSLGIAAAQGRAVSAIEWLCVLAIALGIAVVALTGREAGTLTRGTLGAALAWAAIGAAGFAVTFALSQQAARQGSEVPVMVVTRVTALVGIAILCLAARSKRPAPGSIPVLAGMGVLDAAALGLVTASAGLPTPEYAAVAAALFGVLTILLAWRILGERVAPLQWLGIAMVFAGIGVLSLQG